MRNVQQANLQVEVDLWVPGAGEEDGGLTADGHGETYGTSP